MKFQVGQRVKVNPKVATWGNRDCPEGVDWPYFAEEMAQYAGQSFIFPGYITDYPTYCKAFDWSWAEDWILPFKSETIKYFKKKENTDVS